MNIDPPGKPGGHDVTARSDEPTPHEPEQICPSCEVSYGTDHLHCPVDGTKLIRVAPVTDPMLGRVIDGRFRITDKLGEGGMGTVYRAWQASVGREVALKVLVHNRTGDRTAARRFLREAKLASRMSQPNTVSVFDFGQTDEGQLYLVMELVKGQHLGQLLASDGRFSVQRAAHIGTQLLDALDAAHTQKIIHRDLKPSNIIVLDDPPGRDLIKVLDFGLAKSLSHDSQSKVTNSGVMVGTPSYMSPETVLGTGEDERTDLYAVGIILYELLAGRRPFLSNDLNAIVAMHAYDAPPTLGQDVPADVSRVVFTLLEKNPANRFSSAAIARRALRAATDNPSATTHAPDLCAAPEATLTSSRGRPAGDKARGERSAADTNAADSKAVPDPVDQEPSQKPRARRSAWLGLAALSLVAGVGIAVAAGVFSGGTEQAAGAGGLPATSAGPAAESLTPATSLAPEGVTAPGDAAPAPIMRMDGGAATVRASAHSVSVDAMPRTPRAATARARRRRVQKRRARKPRPDTHGSSSGTKPSGTQPRRTKPTGAGPEIDYELPR